MPVPKYLENGIFFKLAEMITFPTKISFRLEKKMQMCILFASNVKANCFINSGNLDLPKSLCGCFIPNLSNC